MRVQNNTNSPNFGALIFKKGSQTLGNLNNIDGSLRINLFEKLAKLDSFSSEKNANVVIDVTYSPRGNDIISDYTLESQVFIENERSMKVHQRLDQDELEYKQRWFQYWLNESYRAIFETLEDLKPMP
jgi:hypothetical protein